MVVPSSSSMFIRSKKTKAVGIPIIDLSRDKSIVRKLIVKPCEEYGFFKAINHGVSKLEEVAINSGNFQIGNLQDGANTDCGGVVWWQGLSDTFSFLIPILYTALQVIYQGKSESPFVTHQTNMWISIIATCIYAFSFTATKKATNHKTTYFIVINHIAFFSGALSTLSILSVLLSFKLALIFFVIWSLAFAFFTLKLIYCHFNLHTNNWTKSLCDKFNKLQSYFVKSFSDKFNKLRGGGDTNTDTTLSPQHPIDGLV